jgi:LAS superfamily LD-carboxypeptidase LdcB
MKQKPRIYQGKLWYLKKGMAPMAVPGTSNHNWGIAIDIANASGKRLDWLLANADKFGFSWELQSEPWHLRYVCGDAVPEAVKDWLANKPAEDNA